MVYEVVYERRALHEMDKLESLTSKRIVQKIEELRVNPSSCDIKKMKDSDFHRLRVGDYRILFVFEGNLIKIFKIGRRETIYG